jgi:two-component system, cell cycle sensor histidine kinase and response regulator CckA
MPMAGEVLIVDDTPENLQVLGAILRAEGLTVRLAQNGSVALRSVAARRPDIVLLDIRMPEMDGFETCRRLQADQAMQDIPILFLSATQEREERLKAFAVGGLDFISKPFSAEEVLARVRTHLALSRFRRDLASSNVRLTDQYAVASEQRVVAEGVAREREMHRDLALAAAGMGSWTSEADGSDLRLDTAACLLFGLGGGQPPGDWDSLLLGFAADERDAVRGAWMLGLGGGRIFDVEGWWESGRSRRRLRLRGCTSHAGGATRPMGLVWDVTDDHHMRQRLVQSEKLESLGQLAGGVAHDFNNHLAVIFGNIDLLRRATQGDPRSLERLETIDRATTCASALVRDLLTFARRSEVVLKPCSLAEVVGGMRLMSQSLLGSRRQVEMGALDASVRVNCSQEQLQNAVLNLCVNARDAMPEGGRLRIAVVRERIAGEVCRICGRAVTDTCAVLTVADDGSGIPTEIQDSIFEPFFTTKAEGKGTGLGLATVVGCVRAHHGHLFLHSAPGEGTTFRIALPDLAVTV